MIVDDVIVQHLRFDLLVRAHLLAHGAFHTSQTSAVLVLDELANGAHASVTKVVDVVDVGFLALTLDQAAHGLDDILARERGIFEWQVATELLVDLDRKSVEREIRAT